MAYDTKRQAQRCNDKGKFTYLGHRESTLHGCLQRIATDEISQRTKYRLTDKNGQCDSDDGPGVIDQHLRFDQHTHRHEENSTEEIFHWFDQTHDFVGFDRFGKNTTHDKCTKSTAKADLGGEYCHETTETKRHDE